MMEYRESNLLKPRSRMYCNLSATALRLKNSCNQCNHCAIKKLHFSAADQSATGRRQLSLSIGDQSATGRRLVGDWLPTDWKWVGIGRQLVGDWSATGQRWVGDWLLIKQFAVLV